MSYSILYLDYTSIRNTRVSGDKMKTKKTLSLTL